MRFARAVRQCLRFVCVLQLATLLLPAAAGYAQAPAGAPAVKAGVVQPGAPAAKAAKKPGSPDYSNEPLVVEHSATIYDYRADGTGERTMRTVLHLQSDAAVRQFGVVSFAYAADSESIELHYVRVRKPDGTVVATEASAAQDQPAEVTRQAPLYSDQRQLQVPVRSLAVGDRLEYEAVVHMRKAEAPGAFWGALYFEPRAVSLDERIELRYPSSVKVTVLSPENKPVQSMEDGKAVYRWQKEQTRPTVAPPGGAAPAGDEKASPKQIPDVAWTTFKSWAGVGEWYRTLAADRAAPDAGLRAKSAALTQGAASDDEKIDRIYSFVSMQIRYIGVDFGVGRFQPHTAAEVLANGYGDCKDKHTLLAALLAAAGFRADPVLIGEGIHMDKDLPAPNSFNHVITVVERAGGKRLWLDATAEVAPPGMLVAALRDEDALLIVPTDAGEPLLTKTPAVPPFEAFDHYEARGTLTREGKLNAHFDVTMRGDLELLMRAALFASGRGQWLQIGQGLSGGMGFGGTVSGFTANSVDAPGQPLSFAYDYEREDYGDWANHRILALLPGSLFAETPLTKQPDTPIELGAPRLETARSTITLPEGFTVPALPGGVHAQSSFGSFELTYTLHPSGKNTELVTEARLEIKSASLPASGWMEFSEFAKTVTANGVFIELAENQPATPGGKPGAATLAAIPAPAATADSSSAGLEFTTDTRAQQLLQQAAAALKTGDTATAQTKIDQARGINPKQPGLLLITATLAANHNQFKDAEDEIGQELKLYPGERPAALPILLWMQVRQQHRGEAIATLEELRKLKPGEVALTRQEAALLTEEKRHEEAVSLLEGVALRNPSDKLTMLSLGRAQLAAGRSREAAITLEAALEGTDDPLVLNDAAYELADHNVDLPLASKNAQRALELLSAKSNTLEAGNVGEQDIGQQRLMADAWDTMGWIDYLQGNTADAEPLLRAAWISSQHPEVGYHLGMLYEKEGKRQQALEVYELGAAAGAGSAGFRRRDELRAREDALTGQGLHASFAGNAGGMLGRQRSLRLGAAGKQQGSADFLVLATANTLDVQFLEGDASLKEQRVKIADALTKDRSVIPLPAGSGSKLLRRGTLFCSSATGVCEFTVFLLQDTHLPAVAAPQETAQVH